MTDQAKLAVSRALLSSFLTRGDVATGHRSAARAETLLPAVAEALELPDELAVKMVPYLKSYTTDVILGAAWYARKYRRARWAALSYIGLNAALVIGIPLGIAYLGRLWSSSKTVDSAQYGALLAQLSSVLTGIFALQKTVSAWYAQQQNYAGWYKSGADLKELYYTLLKKWAGKIVGSEMAFLQDLQEGESAARQVMRTERIDYYTRLALPSFDVLDMLTASKAKVSELVTSLTPAEKKTEVVAIGTKSIVGLRTIEAESATEESGAESKIDLAATANLLRNASLVIDDGLPAFDQQVVDACAGVTISNAADLISLFGDRQSFYEWFNVTFQGVAAVAKHYQCRDTQLKRNRFTAFWDQIDVIFGRASVSAIEFCALMAINLEESDGDLSEAPEKMNNSDQPHPGLAYAFDRIPEARKQSYNHAPNRTALELFRDALFKEAHGALPGANDVLRRPGGIDTRWGGESWPDGVSTRVDSTINGFIMQADFYKFRGRGVIQTTWRSDYKLLIEWILSDEAETNAVLATLATKWKSTTTTLNGAAQVEAIATISSNDDWNIAFGEGITLAKGVAIDSAEKGDYLNGLGRTAEVLGADRKTPGSLLNFAAHINGAGYPDRVAPMMKALMCGIAETIAQPSRARLSRTPETLSV